jgi:uncharacterized protein (TIGR02099 family)
MIQMPSHPSRLLRLVAGLARWSLGLLLAFWLLLALAWGALHGWIVPRIGEFRAQLETHASAALGVPVQIGQLHAHSEGLLPWIEARDLALLDSQGRVALQLPKVVVTLSPRSLLRRGFEQLSIDTPELDIRRTSDGQLLIAGLKLGANTDDNNAGSEWFFSQTEVSVSKGVIRWTDELRGTPTLALHDVDLLLRNGRWRHAMRIDATPPSDWGDRFTLMGEFRAPLLQLRTGDWQQWSGQLYAHFGKVDLSHLKPYTDLGVEVAQGQGALRAWLDVQRGQATGGAADVMLTDIRATLGKDLQALQLPALQGRLGGRKLAHGFEVFTQGLEFTTEDGLVWPGGNARLKYTEPQDKAPEHGEFSANQLELAALAKIASHLPLGAVAHTALQDYAPQGLVENVKTTWQGPLDAPQQYELRGTVTQLSLADHKEPHPKRLGIHGAQAEVHLSQDAGRATVNISNGALILPGVFEESRLPLDHFSADVRWQIKRNGTENSASKVSVQADNIRFSNADAEGQGRLAWHTGDAETSQYLPGVLDLSGNLTRADGTRVYRYLPLSVEQDARQYVRDAVVAGRASRVQFKVKGDLEHLPFSEQHPGDFHIAAQVQDVTYAYVPAHLQPPNTPRWPALTKLSGELVFDKSSMLVRGAQGVFAGTPNVRLSKVEAQIPDLSNTLVSVRANARGPLGELLTLVNTSPLSGMMGNALERASGSGPADFVLQLQLPIADLNQSKVQGSLTLAGNDVQIMPTLPMLSKAKGAIEFNESGFSIAGIQARALGGDVRLEGQMRGSAPAGESSLQLRAQGIATALGLQEATYWGSVASMARHASGSTPYTMQLGLRRGVPEVLINSRLEGMALALPAPLNKPAERAMPLRIQTTLLPTGPSFSNNKTDATLPLIEQLAVDVQGVGSAVYQTDVSGNKPRVLRGLLQVGTAAAADMPSEGVKALLRAPAMDIDAWIKASNPAGTDMTASAPPNANTNTLANYLPSALEISTQALTWQGRTLHDLTATMARQGNTWRGNLDARELNGSIEYQMADANERYGRIKARLGRVNMPHQDDTSVGSSTPEPLADNLPSMDIVVDNFQMRGHSWGRVAIEAQSRPGKVTHHEWRLNKFNITTPEGKLTAVGNWAPLGDEEGMPGPRRTVMNFTLDIDNAGGLLDRFGMQGVIRKGEGRMSGQVAWVGTPLSPHYPTMTGQVHMDVGAGQFLKADPGIAKLLGVLSLQSLPRRLTLDFRDVFSEGFSFDFVRGDVTIDQGVASTNNLQMKGVNAAVLMEGSADIAKETQNLHVVVVPEINAMTASLVATAINPVVGLGSFLAQVFLRGPLIEAATQEFRVDGTWADPRVMRIDRRTGKTSDGAAPAAPPVSTPVPPTGVTP